MELQERLNNGDSEALALVEELSAEELDLALTGDEVPEALLLEAALSDPLVLPVFDGEKIVEGEGE